MEGQPSTGDVAGTPVARPGPASGGRPGARSLRERVGALRNVPPFLALVWQTSPALTLGTLVLRLVRALLPVATPLCTSAS